MSGDNCVYVVSATRTPIGSYLGSLADMPAPRLGAVAVKSAVERASLKLEQIDEVYMGNVLSAGLGQAPARQAAIYAGIPNTVPCTTVSKVCGSGLQSIVFGTRAILLGDAELVVAGGMESMSNAPYYLTKARTGYRMGDGNLIDGMIFDGLWDPYNNLHMGSAGDKCAAEYQLTREMQDEYAKESYRRARKAMEAGHFKGEITPVPIAQRKGDPLVVSTDEEPGKGDPSKFGSLRPAFEKNGTVTAANASTLNDGAAAVVLASRRAVEKHGLSPLGRIVGYGGAAQAPEWFTTAPAKAIENTLSRLKLKTSDIDLWEINEAFSCVPMACAKIAGLDLTRVNVWGGAVSLGHPIGASGARIVVTLLSAMKERRARRGLATLCIGGGEAVAVVLETVG